MRHTTMMAMLAVASLGCTNLLGIDDFSDGETAPVDDRDLVGGAGGLGGGGAGGGGAEPTSDAWAVAFGAASSEDMGHSVMVTTDDEIVVTGTIGGVVDFGGGTVGSGNDQLFVTRLSSAGEHRNSIASIGTANIESARAAIDAAGNVVVAGAFANGSWSLEEGIAVPALGSDIFVAAVSPAGAVLWNKAYSAPDQQAARAVAIDPSDGSVVVVGSLRGDLTFDDSGPTVVSSGAGGDDVLVARFSGSGQLSWARTFGDASSQVATAVAIGNDGTIWVAGTFDGTLEGLGSPALTSIGNSDIFLARLSATGAVESSSRFGNGGGHTVGALAVADGGVVMVGGFTGTTSFGGEAIQSDGAASDIFVASLDASGHRWSRGVGGTGPDVGLSVALDGDGNIVVGGGFSGELLDVGGNQQSGGGQDALVLWLDPDGDVLASTAFGRNDDDHVGGLAVDGNNAVIATGYFVDAFMFGDEVIHGKGMQDVFVAKLY